VLLCVRGVGGEEGGGLQGGEDVEGGVSAISLVAKG
jgi:hypothetical protein